MAEQGVSPHTAIVVSVAPPLAPHHGEASPSSSPHGSSLVKAFDRKARSYLKTLERSLSFSAPDTSGEDSSSMTIEFLRARLQAQRAEYKAERQRAQQLAKKVLELEQRLNFEIERRKKAERSDMLISPSYHSSTPNSKGSQSFMEREEGLASINSKFKENSSGEEDHSDWCSEISGSEGHPEGDGIVLISPSSLRRHWETSRHGRQMANHNGSYFTNDINAASVLDKESIVSNHKELREKPCEAPHCDEPLEGPKGTVDLENTNLPAVPTKFMPDSTSKTLNAPHSIDPQSSRIVNTFDICVSKHKEPSEAGHIVSHNCPHRQASIFYGADIGFTSESSQHHIYAAKATTCRSINYFARPIDNGQNCRQTFSRDPSSPCNKMVGTNFLPQSGKYIPESHASLEVFAKRPESGTFKGTNTPQLSKSMSVGQDTLLEYIVAGSNKIKEMQEEGPSVLRQETSLDNESKYGKEILSPHFLCTKESREISPLGRSSEKLDTPHKNGSFSAVQTRHRWRFHGHRMSLDGGLDRLQEAGRADWSSSKISK